MSVAGDQQAAVIIGGHDQAGSGDIVLHDQIHAAEHDVAAMQVACAPSFKKERNSSAYDEASPLSAWRHRG